MLSVDNFELIRRFMHFESTDQFYFMQILQRKKDGPGPNGIVCGTNNKARAIKSYCITSVEMLDRISIEVKHLCEYFNARAYLYPVICAPFDLASFKERYPDIDVHKSNLTILYCLKD